MKDIKVILWTVGFILMLWMPFLRTEAGTIFDSPYVNVTADGEAWTTCPGELHNEHYKNGYMITTGVTSGKRMLREGEHLYQYERTGAVPVGYWRVTHDRARCIHGGYPEGEYHDIPYRMQPCGRSYTQGWFAFCADCDRAVEEMHIYACEEAVGSIHFIPIGMDYYYLCPHCSNLEQGNKVEHICEKNSWNRYKVIYDANTEGLVAGNMQPSFHMYNNATTYEGKRVNPQTHLNELTYRRVGYEFVCWNTERDGSGISYGDGEEIYNLSAENYTVDGLPGCVFLYAQWRLSESCLEIDPSGGSYLGNAGITVVKQLYQSRYDIEEKALIVPEGAVLSFVTNGGDAVAPIRATCHFEEWIWGTPFVGWFSGNSYYFQAPGGNVDRLTAKYAPNAICLPAAQKSNASFGGWYYDAEFTRPAGSYGDEIIITENTTLYAQWVDLTLSSRENYSDNQKRGAVDLSWSQSDKRGKVYKLFCYKAADGDEAAIDAGTQWTEVHTTSDMGDALQISESLVYSGKTESITIPYTGLYELVAAGAQGGSQNGGNHVGGFGGEAKGSFWLSAGDVLTIDVGGQNGYGGGGSGESFGNGGGCTKITSARQGILLVAGGGGGATIKDDGGPGGGSMSLRGDREGAGESGGAGGGAGYVGGTAGELLVHRHSETCYDTETTEYTLFDDSGISEWMKQYWSRGEMHREFAGNCWGGLVFREGAAVAMQCHSGGEEEINFFSHLMALGAYANKQKPSWAGSYIPVNGNTNADISVFIQDWGSDTGLNLNGSYLKVYNQDGRCIYSRTLLPGTTQRYEVRTSDATIEYVPLAQEINNNGIAGLYRDYKQGHSWTDDDNNWHGIHFRDYVSGTISVPLPTDTTEVYIELYTRVDTGTAENTNHKSGISGVRFTGGVNRKIICGHKEGQVISSKAGYGGSNYINTAICGQYTEKIGSNKGDGYFRLKSESVGFLENMSLKGVPAPDEAAPDSVKESEIKLYPVDGSGGEKVNVQWQTPKDNGTGYFFVVESYAPHTGTKICRSNITYNSLKTGVMGYRYIVDTRPKTGVTAANSVYTTGQSLQLGIHKSLQYLHLASVDVAGNISETTTVCLGSLQTPVEVHWPIFTEQLEATAEEGIYPATDDTYYVRCDGNTPIELGFSSYMEGAATEKYQITHTIFEAMTEGGVRGRNKIETRPMPIRAETIVTDGRELRISAEGESALQPYLDMQTVRSNYNKRISVKSKFTVAQTLSGQALRVTPLAAASTAEGLVYSDYHRDLENSIYLVGDCQPPVISGTDLLEERKMVNRKDGPIRLSLKAWDELSGLAEFSAFVYNEDNTCSKTYVADASGEIALDITEESPLFEGNFKITVFAADRVGNRVTESFCITEFAMETKVSRILAPHEPVFKRGESGILSIEAWGHIEKIEVEFAAALSAYDKIVIYDEPEYKNTEEIQFMIPLDMDGDGPCEIRIRAYKDENQLADTQELTIYGTVLDDLRTRVR